MNGSSSGSGMNIAATTTSEFVKVLPSINHRSPPQFMKCESIETNKTGFALGLDSTGGHGGCFYCGEAAELLCNWCRSVFYCGQNHYQYHRHRSKCYPFKIAFGDGAAGGHRKLLASRDIR